MPGCSMHRRPKLAEKARYNSLLKINSTTTTTKIFHDIIIMVEEKDLENTY